jgi:hypothetical protein
MLLWRFVGKTNIILSNGENWKRHSRVVKSALNRNLPIEDFVSLGKKLFSVMGQGGERQKPPRFSAPLQTLIWGQDASNGTTLPWYVCQFTTSAAETDCINGLVEIYSGRSGYVLRQGLTIY